MARPIKDKYKLDFVINTIDKYTNETELPIVKEVCVNNKWDVSHIYSMAKENPELDQSIKRLIDKKETELERGGLTGKYKTAMAIFSLKQLGWKDTIELESSNTESNPIKIEMKPPSEEDLKRVKELKERLFKQE